MMLPFYFDIGLMIFAYLLGSFSSALVVTKLMKLPDPLSHGSGNPGATNVLRTCGKFPALLVLLGDVIKGFVPVYIAKYYTTPNIYLGIIAIAACIGHIYPLYFHFKGGKGVATALGAIIAISWIAMLVMLVIWLAVAIITRYSSLAAILSALCAPFVVWLVTPQFTLPIAMLSCLIIWRHYENIERLLSGKEPKIREGH